MFLHPDGNRNFANRLPRMIFVPELSAAFDCLLGQQSNYFNLISLSILFVFQFLVRFFCQAHKETNLFHLILHKIMALLISFHSSH